MEDITVEQLKAQIQRAESCVSVTLPSGQLKPLLNLAMKKSLRDSATIARLQRAARGLEAKLTGDELRLILDFALQEKLLEIKPRPRLKVVPPTTRS